MSDNNSVRPEEDFTYDQSEKVYKYVAVAESGVGAIDSLISGIKYIIAGLGLLIAFLVSALFSTSEIISCKTSVEVEATITEIIYDEDDNKEYVYEFEYKGKTRTKQREISKNYLVGDKFTFYYTEKGFMDLTNDSKPTWTFAVIAGIAALIFAGGFAVDLFFAIRHFKASKEDVKDTYHNIKKIKDL